MDFIDTAWRNGPRHTGGIVAVIPPNFGTEGGYRHSDWTPAYQTPLPYIPQMPTWNKTAAVDWNQYVLTEAEQNALVQAGLIQLQNPLPARFVPPGTASLSLK